MGTRAVWDGSDAEEHVFPESLVVVSEAQPSSVIAFCVRFVVCEEGQGAGGCPPAHMDAT